jgi:hypothetical protein
MSNPFDVEIPKEFRMTVDRRAYEAKLDDSYHLVRIIKWLCDNRPASEDAFDCHTDNASAGVIDILTYLVDCEKAIDAIREAIGNV